MNYDPIPTTSKQAAMAMTIANAGKPEVSRSKKRKIDQDEDPVVNDPTVPDDGETDEDFAVGNSAIKNSAIEDDVIKDPTIPDDSENDDEDSAFCLTQGKNSNITDQHALFFMREQELAIERQRLFLSKKK